jgi:DNA-binding CsgD family transcriptional regulator
MESVLTKNHITLTSCAEVLRICAPFFKDTGISYYNYVRLDDKNQRICLSNNKPWMEYVFSTLDIHKITFESTPEHGQQRYVVWDNIESIGEDKLMVAACETYNIAHGFTIISNFNDYVEYHYFGTSKGNKSINNFYITNLDQLNSFILYFKERAHSLINAAEKQYILINNPKFWVKDGNSDRDSLLIKSSLTLNRYYLSGIYKSIYLTKREAECLTCMCDGFTAKKTAQSLALSPKTIQKHIESVKIKLGCSYKDDLIKAANSAGFSQISNIVRKSIKAQHEIYA